MSNCKQVDISELYDLFTERKDGFFVCCDIQHMTAINQKSRKLGDHAILQSMKRISDASGKEDVVFRIGGDEFVLLTGSTSVDYAHGIADAYLTHNGELILADDGQETPLSLYASITRLNQSKIRYHELFNSLHLTIETNK